MSQKGLAPILIIILLAALVGGYFWFSYSNNQTKVTPVQQTFQPSAAPDETANWKTYTNSKYGFSFKYPDNDNWKFNSLTSPITNSENTFLVECNNRCLQQDNIESFQVSLVPYKSLDEYIANGTKNADNSGAIDEYIKIQLDNSAAIEAASPGVCNPGTDSCENSSIEIFLVHNSQGILIKEYFNGLTHISKLNQFPNPDPNILSTFKFTN